MSITPTDEQRAAIDDDLISQAIVACAGSGKTASAVRRVAHIRRTMEQRKGYVALLSYSNVAVDTFRAEYRQLTHDQPGLSDRVVIATVDSFIATNILLPHGPTSMRCPCRPFLVQGGEGWLAGFTVTNGTYPAPIREIEVSLDGGAFAFTHKPPRGLPTALAANRTESVVERLAKVGAYTHALARYWALRALTEQERIISILARRYPYVLIDEAQDVGSMHGALVSVLREAGVTVSLIGDPHQAIFEFADADGGFLRSFDAGGGVVRRPLTENHRSVTQIVTAANALSAGDSKAIRKAPTRKHGAFYIHYAQGRLGKLVDTYKAILAAHGYQESEAAILCRGNPLVDSLLGGGAGTGTGGTERLAQAAIYRDCQGAIGKSFECVVDGVLKLLDNAPQTLRNEILANDTAPEVRSLRRLLWCFLKNTDSGLPESSLRARDEWHPRLKERLPALFKAVEAIYPLKRSAYWGNNLTVKDLGDGPLLQRDLISAGGVSIRTLTVHKAKGQSIESVLYIARKADLESMLAGTGTEVGRIGYVAVTRARDLLIVAIPSNTADDVIKRLETKGFVAWA